MSAELLALLGPGSASPIRCRPAALQAWWILCPPQPCSNWQQLYPAVAFIVSCMRFTGRGGMSMPGGQLIIHYLCCTESGTSQNVPKPENLDGITSKVQVAAVELSGLCSHFSIGTS